MYAYVISIMIVFVVLVSSPVLAQDSGDMIKNLFGTMLQGAIRKQQDKQFRKNWQLCFERNQIDACDKALSHPHLKAEYRKTILDHRNKILGETQEFDEQSDPATEFTNQNSDFETQLSEERRLRSDLQQQLSDAHRQAENLKRALQQEQFSQRDLKQQLQTAEIKLAGLEKRVGDFDREQNLLERQVQSLKAALQQTEQSKTQQQQIFIGVLIATSLLSLVLTVMVFRRPRTSESLPVDPKASDASDEFGDIFPEPHILPKPHEASESVDETPPEPTLKPHTVTLTGNLIDDVRHALHA